MSAPAAGRDRVLAVTGGTGFVGWHLRSRLRALRPDIRVRVVDRACFADEGSLAERLDGVDGVVHLAGANRGPDAEVEQVNVELARALVAALDRRSERSGPPPNVVYAGSIHAGGDSPYGRSKRVAGETLAAWGERAGAPVAELAFPNLYGECGRPNYNSAVATFCHDLARGEPSTVNPDGRTELLHVQDACALVIEALESGAAGVRRVAGTTVAIPDLYGRLRGFRECYREAHLPALADRLDLGLFNALRTAMFPAHYPLPLTRHADHRGAFVELARGHGQTQVSFSTTAPGVTRGEHFHLDKIERFVVVRGSAVMRVRRLFGTEVVRFAVTGDRPVVVDMPPLHAHDITNTGGDELLTAFWANDHFDPQAPDTYAEPVEPDGLAEPAAAPAGVGVTR